MSNNTLNRDKKAVVTGGAGFVGSHLSEELVKRGYRVDILDDLSSGEQDNIRQLIDEGSVEFHRGSILNPGILKELFRDAYYVFHLAAIASVPLSIENPVASHDVNAGGTLNVLEAARDCGVKRVVYASSCAVYGDTDVIPTTEDTPPDPQSPYAVAKLSGEYYCRLFHNMHNLSTISLRFYNIFGPRQNPDSPYSAVIPLFMKEIYGGKTPIVFGDGTQTRDFVYVKDAVSACIVAAKSDSVGEYNIGSGVGTSINRLFRLITELSGKEIEPVYKEPRKGDIIHSLSDISKIKKIGYKPSYNLEEGLKDTINSLYG